MKIGVLASPKVDQIALVNHVRARDYGQMSSVSIRPATLDDLADLYRVAIKTGDSGSDATGMFRNDDMIGEVYVGPYLTLASETCFALESNDRAVGYGLCVLDTETSQSQARDLWWPKLQEKYHALSPFIESEWLIHEIFRHFIGMVAGGRGGWVCGNHPAPSRAIGPRFWFRRSGGQVGDSAEVRLGLALYGGSGGGPQRQRLVFGG